MDWENGKKVLRTGARLVRYTKWLLWLIPAAVGLFLLCMIGVAALSVEHLAVYVKLGGPIGMVNFLLLGSYAVFALGVCDLLLYFVGIHFMGLGQLVLNTCPPREELPQEPEEEPEEKEEVPEEPQREEPEEETDWHALLEQDDAVIPAIKTPEQLVQELPPPGKSGRLVSPALMNILRYALGLDEDGAMKASLKNGITRLTKTHEKELLGFVLHTPDGDVRTATDRLYKALSQRK